MNSLKKRRGQGSGLRLVFLISALCVLSSKGVVAADAPRGFFLEDLRRTPPIPALYNLETRKLEPLRLKKTYVDFLDVAWDHAHGRVFFSARDSRQQPYRVYMKAWPDGEEEQIYENPTGPFRFVVSPDGERLALQVMGPASWPILGVYHWKEAKWTRLGEGYSPDWSLDGQRLLFLNIPGALPTRLCEYSVATDTVTQLMKEPVMEAVYTDDAQQIILKTAKQAAQCDIYQVWNRRSDKVLPFTLEDPAACKRKRIAQRELAAFPGHRFFLFKESLGEHSRENQSVVVTDVWGGRLQVLDFSQWDPMALPVEEMTLAVSEDPIYILSADGAGGKKEISQARFFRVRK